MRCTTTVHGIVSNAPRRTAVSITIKYLTVCVIKTLALQFQINELIN